MLGDILIGSQALLRVAKLNMNRSGEEVMRQSADFLRPGGGKHQGLSVPGKSFQDLSDLRLEAHVQHAVRLVHHQVEH